MFIHWPSITTFFDVMEKMIYKVSFVKDPLG